MKILVEFEFDESWKDYEDIVPELIMEDALIEISEGVKYRIIEKIPSREIDFDFIEKRVLDHCQITKEQLHLKTRDQYIIEARRICYYLSREHLIGLSWREIGERFGNKDHATAYNAWLKCTHYLQNNIEFKKRNKIFIESFK